MISAHGPCLNALKYTDTTTDITFFFINILRKTIFRKMNTFDLVAKFLLISTSLIRADLASYNRWGNNFVTVDLRKKPSSLLGYKLKLTEYLVRKRSAKTLEKLSKIYSADQTEQTEKSMTYYNNMVSKTIEPVVATFISI